MAAVMLGGCSTTAARMDTPEAAAQTQKPAAAQTLKPSLEGRSISADTEAIFKRNAKTPVNDNLSDDKRLRAYVDQLCFVPQTAPKPEQLAVREALEDLAKLPLTGRPLVEMAVREQIQFCNIPTLPLGMGAQYVPSLGAVLAPVETDKISLRQTIAHEILHAVQDKSALLSYEHNWDIESRVTRNLSIEAAALSMEVLIAFEARLQGDNAHWDYLQKRAGTQSAYGDGGAYILADETWAKAKAGGKNDADAIRDVGAALWNRAFENRPWLDFYLNFELQAYLRDITAGALDDQKEIRSGGYVQSRIDAAGKIGTGESFTKGVGMPPLEKLLAGSTAEADGNPYLGLDLAKIVERSRAHTFGDDEGKRKFAYLHEYMDAAAGRTRVQTAAPAPLPPIQPPAPPEAKPAAAAPEKTDNLPPPPPPAEEADSHAPPSADFHATT
ncbi:MAG TPA: hypothetical protein PLW48_04580 [Alphaproteobacteria bacterium]|nr:hypothetical protein [Alphaproteobacteria bacterium]